MTRITAALKQVLADLGTLKRPATAAAVVATILGVTQPLGIDLGVTATQLVAVLAGIGVIGAFVDHLLYAGTRLSGKAPR